MKRRDFLRFRSDGGQRIVVLSCQRLYMCYNDCRHMDSNEEIPLDGSDWWSGEPPMAVESVSPQQLFADIAAEIATADVLVLDERDWMSDREFADHMNRLLTDWRAQGGELRYAMRNSLTGAG